METADALINELWNGIQSGTWLRFCNSVPSCPQFLRIKIDDSRDFGLPFPALQV
jgi:hypothetical protein